MDGLNFYFNGKFADEFGVSMISLDSGMKSTHFLAERDIISESIPNNPIPYVYGVQYKPLQFKLVLSCLEDEWTLEKRRQVARWLSPENFEEFYNEDFPDRRYFFMYQGGIDLTYNGAYQGYIEVDMLNISPFVYSPIQTKQIDCSVNDTTTFSFINEGDDVLKPELTIYKVGTGDLSILNTTTNKEFKFTGLADKETVYIDNENPYIESDLNILRYDKFNNSYIELPIGFSNLTVTGKCTLKFQYRNIYKG